MSDICVPWGNTASCLWGISGLWSLQRVHTLFQGLDIQGSRGSSLQSSAFVKSTAISVNLYEKKLSGADWWISQPRLWCCMCACGLVHVECGWHGVLFCTLFFFVQIHVYLIHFVKGFIKVLQILQKKQQLCLYVPVWVQLPKTQRNRPVKCSLGSLHTAKTIEEKIILSPKLQAYCFIWLFTNLLIKLDIKKTDVQYYLQA